jgi:hypothetical protein
MPEIRATFTATMKGSRNDSVLTVVQARILNSLSKPSMAVVSSTALARRDICALRIACFFLLSGGGEVVYLRRRRSPRGERGLKPPMVPGLTYPPSSLPTRGTWIETCFTGAYIGIRTSLSARGAWIATTPHGSTL